jgi:hypothetical protein
LDDLNKAIEESSKASEIELAKQRAMKGTREISLSKTSTQVTIDNKLVEVHNELQELEKICNDCTPPIEKKKNQLREISLLLV